MNSHPAGPPTSLVGPVSPRGGSVGTEVVTSGRKWSQDVVGARGRSWASEERAQARGAGRLPLSLRWVGIPSGKYCRNAERTQCWAQGSFALR